MGAARYSLWSRYSGRMSVFRQQNRTRIWANGLGRVANRSLHAQGHVADRTKVTPYLVSAEPSQCSYAVSIEIETGPQLRVGTLQVVEATAFTPATSQRFRAHLG